MVLLDTFSKRICRLPQLRPLSAGYRHIAEVLRPQTTPRSQWGSMNKLLPVFQSHSLVWQRVEQHDEVVLCIELVLTRHWECTKSRSLSESNIRILSETILGMAKDELGYRSQNAWLRRIRDHYRTVLRRHGHVYEGIYFQWLELYCILWTTIIRIAEREHLVKGPIDSFYIMEESLELHWREICDTAHTQAPEGWDGFFSEDGCRGLFDDTKSLSKPTYGGLEFRRLVLYERNWDLLRGPCVVLLFVPLYSIFDSFQMGFPQHLPALAQLPRNSNRQACFRLPEILTITLWSQSLFHAIARRWLRK